MKLKQATLNFCKRKHIKSRIPCNRIDKKVEKLTTILLVEHIYFFKNKSKQQIFDKNLQM